MRLVRILIFLLIPFFSSPIPSYGADTAVEQVLSEDTKYCLECHGQQGLTLTFQNKESVGAYVDAERFSSSVHASLGCGACHSEFSREIHPEREFRSRVQYSAKASAICRQCHADEQIKKAPVHAALLAREGGAPVCSECHSPHAITSIAGGPASASEKQYCLGCHRHGLSMKVKSGEQVSLKVDTEALQASVHSMLSCVDCHFGFSTSEHPKRNFKSSRDFSIAHADACRRCHFDKYTKTLESMHYTVLSRGNLKAPVCTDCHGSHSVARARADRLRSAKRCERCHGEIYNKYVSSVHGSALVNEQNADVPICVDCHTAHTIEDARTLDYREKVPDICGRCHANEDLMNKYGLYTGVVNSYLQDFHGITLKLYRQQKEGPAAQKRRSIATCIDCHGVHDITKTTGPGTNIVKARLVKQCQRCHPGATEEFPDAWLSHYEPSLRNAPLVFLINLGYKIFIPFMLIGLILQILLHVWRYAVNR